MTMKMPQAWVGAKVVKSEAAIEVPTQVKARVDMSPEVAGKGLCPECRKPMTIVQAGPSKSWICAADRISLPIPNQPTLVP